jgi:hypothetical protein
VDAQRCRLYDGVHRRHERFGYRSAKTRSLLPAALLTRGTKEDAFPSKDAAAEELQKLGKTPSPITVEFFS